MVHHRRTIATYHHHRHRLERLCYQPRSHLGLLEQRLEKRRKPDPSCVVCKGSGRIDCFDCCGKGRTNNVDLAMLPNGEWPKWCKTCGGSGLGYCSRCLGTGEYRYVMGFQFMKKNEDGGNYTVRDELKNRKSAADLLPNDETD